MTSESKLLILVPTELERKHLSAAGLQDAKATISCCGFGPVAAASRTSMLLAQSSWQHVVLVGIAGTYGKVEVGEACTFHSVAIDGIGASNGEHLLLPSELCLPQWDDVAETHLHGKRAIETGDQSQERRRIFERLSLTSVASVPAHDELLTVCAASGNTSERDLRVARFPDAVAEDMEAFGVALGCHMNDVPLTVVRGISNEAGDRDVSNWNIEGSLRSAANIVESIIDSLSL